MLRVVLSSGFRAVGFGVQSSAEALAVQGLLLSDVLQQG